MKKEKKNHRHECKPCPEGLRPWDAEKNMRAQERGEHGPWATPQTRLSEAPTPTCGFPQLLKKLLVEYKSHTADLFHFGFRCCVSVDEVGRDGDGQFAADLFPTKPWRERCPQKWWQLAWEVGT